MTDDEWDALGARWASYGVDLATVHNSVRRTMPCSGGRAAHKYDGGVCVHCRTDRHAWPGERVALVANCWFHNCDADADRNDERWVTEWPQSEYDWRHGSTPRTYLRADQGACDWCIEKHRREDARREVVGRRAHYEFVSGEAVRQRREDRDRRREEENARWEHERRERQERRRQWMALRDGRHTMSAIRRVLRGQEPSQQPESTPARSSQT